jgi:hypothetical protein
MISQNQHSNNTVETIDVANMFYSLTKATIIVFVLFMAFMGNFLTH